MIGYSSPDWGMGGWYDRQERMDALEIENERLMNLYREDCRRHAEKEAVGYYLEEMQSRPETLAEKQRYWQESLIETAGFLKDENIREAMRLFVDDGWEEFTYWPFVIKQAKVSGVFKGMPEIKR